MSRESAQAKIKVPAIGILATGVVGGLFGILGLIQNLMGKTLWTMPEGYEQYAQTGGALGIGTSILNLAICALLIVGGRKMQAMESYGLCIAACIIAIIPCFGCCLIGIPFGIWGLVVLLNEEVKQAFAEVG